MDVGDEAAHDVRRLVEVLAGAPHVALPHGLEVGEELALGQQGVHAVQGVVDGGVVDQVVGVHGGGVELLHGHGHGGAVAVRVGEILEDVAPAGDLDHAGDVVPGCAHADGAVGADVEEGHGLFRVLKVLQLLDDGGLGVEEGVRLLLPVHQNAVELDPLGAAQGMGLVAGSVDEHRDAQQLDHLLHLGGVQDHRGFDGQLTALVDHQLVVRLAVLAGEEHVPGLDGGHGVVDVPARRGGAHQADAVQGVQLVEQRHGGGRRQVDVLDGLLQHRDVSVQALGHGHGLGHHQEARAVLDVDERVAALVVVHAEARGVEQLHAGFVGEARQLRRGQRPGGQAARDQNQRQREAENALFHIILLLPSGGKLQCVAALKKPAPRPYGIAADFLRSAATLQGIWGGVQAAWPSAAIAPS